MNSHTPTNNPRQSWFYRQVGYKQYNAQEQAFLAAHKADEQDIKTCLDWLHENSINHDQNAMQQVRQHYKKLAPLLKNIQLESFTFQETKNTVYNAMVIDALANYSPSDANTPTEEKSPDEQFSPGEFIFRLEKNKLAKLISMLVNFNDYAEAMARLKLLAQTNNDYVFVSGQSLDDYIHISAQINHYRGHNLSDEGIHEVFEDLNGQPQLKITKKDFAEHLQDHEHIVKIFSSEPWATLLAEANEPYVNLDFKILKQFINLLIDIKDSQVTVSDDVARDYSRVPASESFLFEYIKTKLKPYHELAKNAEALMNDIFGKSTTNYLELQRALGNMQHYDLILLLNTPKDKVDTMIECLRLARITHELNLWQLEKHWLIKWVNEKPRAEAENLTCALAWLRNYGLLKNAYCEALDNLSAHIKDDQFVLFKPDVSQEIKTLLFDTYLCHLKNLELENRPSPIRI